MNKVIGIFFIICILPTFACINEYSAKLDGSISEGEPLNNFPKEKNEIELKNNLEKAEQAYNDNKTIENYSDFGANLLYNGKYEREKSIFLSIENQSPNRYITAANLGTTYELLGKNDSALVWLKKAIRLSPDAHYGSEWIHVNILEAKLNQDKIPLIKADIIGLHFGEEAIPKFTRFDILTKVRQQLLYQLSERMTLVKPKDDVIAKLLFDLGNITAILDDVPSALVIYGIAEEYGYDSELFRKRIDKLTQLQKRVELKYEIGNHLKDNFGKYFLLLITLLLVGIFLLLKRRNSIRK